MYFNHLESDIEIASPESELRRAARYQEFVVYGTANLRLQFGPRRVSTCLGKNHLAFQYRR